MHRKPLVAPALLGTLYVFYNNTYHPFIKFLPFYRDLRAVTCIKNKNVIFIASFALNSILALLMDRNRTQFSFLMIGMGT